MEAFVSKGGVLLKCDAIHATSGVARLTDGHLEDIHTNRQTSTHTHTHAQRQKRTQTHTNKHTYTQRNHKQITNLMEDILSNTNTQTYKPIQRHLYASRILIMTL